MLEKFENRILFSGETGLRADYFDAPTDQFSNTTAAVASLPTATETDQTVNFNWGTAAPVAGLGNSAFEARWSGQVESESAGSYLFTVQSSGAVRLWINGKEIINNWTGNENGTDISTAITLAANTQYNIRLDFYQDTAAADDSIKLLWTAPGAAQQVIPAANLYPFMQATAFTSGGIYVGSWESTNPSVITLEDSTMQPVTIADSIIRGSGTLISDTLAGVQLTVQNTVGYGLNPEEAGVEKGSFLYLMSPASVDIEHNSIIGVGGLGIKIYGFVGTGNETIKIDYNNISESDGRFSDGNGGYEDDGIQTHSIQLANIYNLAGIDIGWNQIINDPGQSYVNDVISLFDTSGTSASPVNVHDNYIQGIYSLDPETTWDSGSGITTDGDPDLSKEPAYIDIDHNTVVNTGSAGIGVPDGHDVLVFDNTLVCSGYLANGNEFFASGTGIYINDINGGNSSIFYDNGAYDNTVGWIQPAFSQQNGSDEARASDYSLPDADPSLTYGNIDMPLPITSATAAAAQQAWLAEVTDQGISIGPVSLVQNPTSPVDPAPPVPPAAPVIPPTSVSPAPLHWKLPSHLRKPVRLQHQH